MTMSTHLLRKVNASCFGFIQFAFEVHFGISCSPLARNVRVTSLSVGSEVMEATAPTLWRIRPTAPSAEVGDVINTSVRTPGSYNSHLVLAIVFGLGIGIIVGRDYTAQPAGAALAIRDSMPSVCPTASPLPAAEVVAPVPSTSTSTTNTMLPSVAVPSSSSTAFPVCPSHAAAAVPTADTLKCAALDALRVSAGGGLPPCSERFYDAFFACHGYFARYGAWQDTTWVPADCAVDTRPQGTCLFDQNSNVTEIVLLGDSMPRKYMSSLQGILGDVAECADVGEVVDAAFFHTPDMKTSREDCGGCSPAFFKCRGKSNGKEIRFRYLLMEFVLDFEKTGPSRIHWDQGPSGCDFTQNPPCWWPWTTQQVYFNNYFARRPEGYPDEIHIFQNIHDCARRSGLETRRDVRWLVDTVDASSPQSTHIHFWEAASLNPRHQPMHWSSVTSNTCSARMNAAVHEALVPLVPRTAADVAARTEMGATASSLPTWHATHALQAPSSQVIEWNNDGVHFSAEWDRQVMRLMLASYCGR